MPDVHPSAVLSGDVRLHDDVRVGPGCTIEGDAEIAAGTHLIANVHLRGPVRIGAGCTLYPGVCLGFEPQDVKFKPGDATAGVVIGERCLLRENVTIHAASNHHTPTRVGDDCFLMVGSHLGHDARIGNRVVLVNNALLAGHSEVADNVTLSGNAVVHQFTRVGRLAFLSGLTGVSMDVPPFCMVMGVNRIDGVNLVGMRRSGMDRDHITQVRRAFREVFRVPMQRTEMIQRLDELGADCPPVKEMADFVRAAKRSICPGPARPPRLISTWLHHRRRGVDTDAFSMQEAD